MVVFRYILCLLGVGMGIPVLVLIALATKLPMTLSGTLYLLACLLIAVGFVTAPFLTRHFYIIVLAGTIGIILIAGTRIVLAGQNGSSEIKMITLPQGNAAGWIAHLIDEQDTLILGEEIFHRVGGDSQEEHDGLAPALSMIYSEMREGGVFPSPVVPTYLNLQGSNRFDAVVIEPDGQAKFGVVFLHGYMGNVTAQCWVIAQAVKNLAGVTVCPSTNWIGAWWEPQGLRILQHSFAYLRGRGIQEIYLGGYSNGGFGIGRLASELGNEKGLDGLIFIDGFANSAGVREIGVPILVIQGALDERVPAASARQFAYEMEKLGTYVELPADHFLIMKQPGLVQDALAAWLKDQRAGE